jgi:hypothetical protein
MGSASRSARCPVRRLAGISDVAAEFGGLSMTG